MGMPYVNGMPISVYNNVQGREKLCGEAIKCFGIAVEGWHAVLCLGVFLPLPGQEPGYGHQADCGTGHVAGPTLYA